MENLKNESISEKPVSKSFFYLRPALRKSDEEKFTITNDSRPGLLVGTMCSFLCKVTRSLDGPAYLERVTLLFFKFTAALLN